MWNLKILRKIYVYFVLLSNYTLMLNHLIIIIYCNCSSYISGLINEESIYSFTDVTFKDIKTNSKAMLYVYSSIISLKNCIFENILCIGDENESSILLIESNNYENNVKLDNIKISNCKTNSDIIKVIGINSLINFSNSNMTNNTLYGYILNDVSEEVCITYHPI